MNLDFRTRTSFWQTYVSKPITLDSEVFRNTTPAFEGETEKEFYRFIQENLSNWEAEEFIENNGELLGDLANELYETFVEYPVELMFDSREKSEDIVVEGGKINPEWRKYNGFEAKYNDE
jgi:hypothetical protein